MKNTRKYSDDELVSALKDRSATNEAVRYIYDTYFDHLSSLITYNSGTRQDAEDTIQEVILTFIDIVRNNKFRGESSIKTFLAALTRNFWLNTLRTQERASARNTIFELQREQVEGSMLELITERENKKQVLGLLDQTGEMCRKILQMFYYQNLTIREMLEHLPYESEQVIRNKKTKCLQALSEHIKKNPNLLRSLGNIIKDA